MSSHTGLSDSIRASAQRLLRGENPRDFSRPSSQFRFQKGKYTRFK